MVAQAKGLLLGAAGSIRNGVKWNVPCTSKSRRNLRHHPAFPKSTSGGIKSHSRLVGKGIRMSTLAAEFLKNARTGGFSNIKPFRDLQLWTQQFVADRLNAPLPGVGINYDQCAERYVFGNDAPLITRELVSGGSIDDKLVWETLKFPASNFWIEYKLSDQLETDLIRIGLMVGNVIDAPHAFANQRTVVAIVGETLKGPSVVGLFSIPKMPLTPGKSFIHLHWFLDHLAGAKSEQEAKEVDHDCALFLYDLVDCLFLINTPRVCEIRQGNFGIAKKKVRERTGALPFTEYRRMILKVGVGTPQYRRDSSTSETEHERHCRLHRVVGHFRTYREGREQPKVSFVPQHWRGDASLGILLHEREVRK